MKLIDLILLKILIFMVKYFDTLKTMQTNMILLKIITMRFFIRQKSVKIIFYLL